MDQPFGKITDGEIHVWYANPDACRESLLNAARPILSPDELLRVKAMGSDEAAREFLAGRIMIRSLLSQVFPLLAPREWILRLGPRGRPLIANPETRDRLHFSLSHSQGRVALAISTHAHTGMDLEVTSRSARVTALARRFFSKSECEALLALSPEQQRTRFFEIWTLKEAYLKAKSQGLSIPLDSFGFEIDSTGGVRIRFEGPQPDGEESRWRFRLLNFESGFQAALAVSCVLPANSLKVVEHRFEIRLPESG